MSLPGHLVSLVGTATSQFPVIVEPLAPSSSFLISEEYGGMRPNWVADNLRLGPDGAPPGLLFSMTLQVM